MSKECACVYYDNGKCQKFSDDKFHSWCVEGTCTDRVSSNADRIRAMSDEELAEWIAGMTTVCECCAELNECEAPRGFNRCSHGVEDWLKQPYESGE
jgi:hypothetical protein